jgi:hypothetical protein
MTNGALTPYALRYEKRPHTFVYGRCLCFVVTWKLEIPCWLLDIDPSPSDVQVSYVQGVVFYELSAFLDVVAHQE